MIEDARYWASPADAPAPTGPWDTYAGYKPGRHFPTIGPANLMHMHGVTPENTRPVRLVEDPEGDLMGWLRRDPRSGVWEDQLSMVYPPHAFRVCFPYGYENEEERGHGRAVRVRIEPR